MTSRVQPADDELLSEPIHLDDDVDAASAWLDGSSARIPSLIQPMWP
jgi:hypothetical protein